MDYCCMNDLHCTLDTSDKPTITTSGYYPQSWKESSGMNLHLEKKNDYLMGVGLLKGRAGT